jgi:hypothetical protein
LLLAFLLPLAAGLGVIAFFLGAVRPLSRSSPQPPRFRHVIVIVFENRRAGQAAAQRRLRRLRRGAPA